ncbi:hypothetical protein AURDEDRAFT_173819 [Auricularia subglabra TFB-10046 SS5]|nr:hypothetical protein AURDEDRAFT_173819 [Auricularia subglabra TFB-10046 SS5]
MSKGQSGPFLAGNVAQTLIPPGDVQACLDAFLKSVSDPLKPMCCPYCFVIFVASVLATPEAFLGLKKYAHDLWETCIKVVVIYSENDVASLRQQLVRNQLGCGQRAVFHKHKLAGWHSDSFDMFLDALLSLIRGAMIQGENPVYTAHRQEQGFHHRNGIWPTKLTSLFPQGVARTIAALVHWCCTPASFLPLLVLKDYLCTARHVVLPRLMESPCRERLIWALVQVFTPGDDVPWPTTPPPFTGPRTLAVAAALRPDNGNRTAIVHTAVELLDTLQTDAGARSDDVPRFLAGHEALFLTALENFSLQPNEETRMAHTVLVFRCLLRALLGFQNPECTEGPVASARSTRSWSIAWRCAHVPVQGAPKLR